MCVRLLVTFVSPAKTAEPIQMPFVGLTHVGPKKHAFAWGKDRTNPITAARCGKSAMRPFAKLHWTLIISETGQQETAKKQRRSIYTLL